MNPVPDEISATAVWENIPPIRRTIASPGREKTEANAEAGNFSWT
jgi:hypothetical protein